MEKNNEKQNGKALRYNSGKPRYDLVNTLAHRDMVNVLTKGSEKYAPRNWEQGFNWTSIIASLKRHLSAIEVGEDYDAEDGLLHISHLACNAHFLNAMYYIYPQGDDREKYKMTRKYRIGVDVDEVLADFTGAWSDIYPDVPRRPVWWKFDRHIMARFDTMKKNGELDKFFLGIKPKIDPSEFKFEPVCYITARPVDTEITEKWLDNNGYPCSPVFTVGLNRSKLDIAKEQKLDFFIDDNYDHFCELNNNGITCFLFSAPHNERYDVGHLRIKSLNDLPMFQ